MSNIRSIFLVDKKSYIQNNCYQSQLYEAFRFGYEIRLVELIPSNLLNIKKIIINLDYYDQIISVVRLRNLYKYIKIIKDFAGDIPFKIYDQDPWENYRDNSPIKGVYKQFQNNFNLKGVYVTAPFWANKLKKDGLPAHFVKMGMLPKYCDSGKDYNLRPTNLGFCGTLHEHRKIALKKLDLLNIEVKIKTPNLNYYQYLDYLHTLKIFFHDESEIPWICDGEEISRSTGMWIKSIEVAARGTFCIRNIHKEGEAYNLSKIPLINCYSDIDQFPEILNMINNMNFDSRRELQLETVETIRKQYDWFETSEKICKT